MNLTTIADFRRHNLDWSFQHEAGVVWSTDKVPDDITAGSMQSNS